MDFARAVVVGFALFAFAATAAEARTPAGEPSGSAAGRASAQAGETPKGETSIERLLGQRVNDSRGNDLGRISELVLDMRAGEIHAMVLEFGGFLGMGDKHYAFPIGDLRAGEGNKLTVDVDKQKLENAEGFAKGQWPAMDGEYWGRLGGEGQASHGASRQQKPHLVRASKMLAQEVRDEDGEKVGKLRDMVVNLDNGKLRQLVVDVYEAGEAMLRTDAITVGVEDKLVINMTGEELKRQATPADKQRRAAKQR
jgi:sporulation protein YlmC with PRC-barrel domain